MAFVPRVLGGIGAGPGGATIIVPGVINTDALSLVANQTEVQVTRDGGTNVSGGGVNGFHVTLLTGVLGTYPVVIWATVGGAPNGREAIRANFTFDALNEELSVRIVGPAPGVSSWESFYVWVENGPDITATFTVTPYLLEQG